MYFTSITRHSNCAHKFYIKSIRRFLFYHGMTDEHSICISSDHSDVVDFEIPLCSAHKFRVS